MKLTHKDFKVVDLGENNFYFEATLKMKYFVHLEPCANGYDVAIYEKKKDMDLPFLVGQKTCTNLTGNITGLRGPIAIAIANEKINELNL